jgi:hypothetical protein
VASGSPATLPAGMSTNESLESSGALRGLLPGGLHKRTIAPMCSYSYYPTLIVALSFECLGAALVLFGIAGFLIGHA